MAIFCSSLVLPGDDKIGTNPLPAFRNPEPDISCGSDGSLQEEDLKNFGTDAGWRVLPYLMQDR
jgi:hypothetical protein